MNDFFLISPLGFEEAVAAQAREAYSMAYPSEPLPDFRVVYGGVEFQSSLARGLSLNQLAKGATRLLMRVKSFQCRSLSELRDGIDLSDLIPYGLKDSISLSITVRKSKMSHAGAAKESLVRMFKRNKIEVVSSEEASLHLFIRVFKDQAQLSIDTSGQPLYQRGYKTHTTEAPIRENLAHLLIRELSFVRDEDEWKYPVLIDPMSGSGSFVFEGASYYHPIRHRSFRYESWAKASPIEYELPLRSPFRSLQGYDIDPKALQAQKANLENLRQLYSISNIIDPESKDLFSTEPVVRPAERWLISNPPYDIRIEIKRSQASYYTELIAAIDKVHSPQRCGLIIPTSCHLKNIRFPNGWELKGVKAFENGGVPVQFVVWHIQ